MHSSSSCWKTLQKRPARRVRKKKQNEVLHVVFTFLTGRKNSASENIPSIPMARAMEVNPSFFCFCPSPHYFGLFDFQRFSGFHCLVQVPMSIKHGLPLWSLSSSTGCGPHLLSDIRGVDKNAQNTFFTCSQSELTSRMSPPGKSLGCTTSLDLVSSSDPRSPPPQYFRLQ